MVAPLTPCGTPHATGRAAGARPVEGLRPGGVGGPRPRRDLPRGAGRRAAVPRRRLRLRQEHAAQPRRRPRPPVGGHHRPPRPGRPHVPGGRAVPVAHGAGQHRARPAAARACRERDRAPEADQLLHTVHLDGFGDKRPHELSGGMRQRVAIARAFAQEADILLMDEPFGALDAMTRDLLHAELERLWADRNLSVVFVTHNVREAARLADRVVLLSSRPGPGRQRVRRRHRAAPPDGLPRGVARWPPRSPTSCKIGGAPPCPRLTSTPRPSDQRLDAGAGRARRARAGRRRSPSPRPPALVGDLAEARRHRHRPRALGGRGGQRLAARVRAPAAREGVGRARGAGAEAARSGPRSRVDAAARGGRLRDGPGDRRGGRGGGVAGEGAARRVRLVHHRAADDAVDRVVPARRPAVQATEAAMYFVVVLGAAPSIANGLIAGVDTLPPLLPAGRPHDGRPGLHAAPPRRASRRRCRRSWAASSRAGRSRGAA